MTKPSNPIPGQWDEQFVAGWSRDRWKQAARSLMLHGCAVLEPQEGDTTGFLRANGIRVGRQLGIPVGTTKQRDERGEYVVVYWKGVWAA